jgi:hypothetical protein
MRTVKLASAKTLGHATHSVIVHAPSIPEVSWGGPGVPHLPSNDVSNTKHEIKIPNLPTGAILLAAWYTLSDRVHAVEHFELIDVNVSDDTDVQLDVRSVVNAPDYLRISIHVLFSQS